MKPREMLRSKLSSEVAPHLAAIGFKFAPSRLTFSRTVACARQEIAFCLDRWNAENHCSFCTVWGAHALVYRKWHREKFGEYPHNHGLGGLSDWNIPGWSRAAWDRATLTNDRKADLAVIHQLIRDIDDAGLPFVDRISTWEGAANQLLEESWMYDRAADFLLIAGQAKRAQRVLQKGFREFTVGGRADSLDELPRFMTRLRLFFNETTG